MTSSAEVVPFEAFSIPPSETFIPQTNRLTVARLTAKFVWLVIDLSFAGLREKQDFIDKVFAITGALPMLQANGRALVDISRDKAECRSHLRSLLALRIPS